MWNGVDSTTAFDCPKRLFWRLFCVCLLWFARDSAIAKKRVKQCAAFSGGQLGGGAAMLPCCLLVASKDSVRV